MIGEFSYNMELKMGQGLVTALFYYIHRYGDDDSQTRTYSHIIHPDYNANNINNDVCLLKLDKPLNLTATVKPIKLNRREDWTDEYMMVSGWGTLTVSFS